LNGKEGGLSLGEDEGHGATEAPGGAAGSEWCVEDMTVHARASALLLLY